MPFADTSVYKVPDELSDEQVLFLADILPTAFECGVLNGRVEPGDTVAIVGAGPIGLAAIMTAKLFTPGKIVAIDLADARLDKALEFGADVVINNGREDALARVQELTDGLGADVAIEAVGVPETFELCAELIRPGGRVANVGVHGCAATLHLERLWIRDVLITTGLVDTFTTPKLLKLIADGRLDPTPFATHRFGLSETEEAYDVFADAAQHQRAQGRPDRRAGRARARARAGGAHRLTIRCAGRHVRPAPRETFRADSRGLKRSDGRAVVLRNPDPARRRCRGRRTGARMCDMNTTTTSQPTLTDVRVGEAMHRGVLTCEREAPLTEVARVDGRHAVHCVVVESGSGDGGPFWGVVSDLDLVAAATVRNLDDQTAGGSAASPIVMVTPAETLERAAQLMTEHGTAHLLVVDGPTRRPVGVLSTLDIAAALADGG